jgi:hypothetical protein
MTHSYSLLRRLCPLVCLALLQAPLGAQQAAPPAADSNASPPGTAGTRAAAPVVRLAKDSRDGETVQLSPFEVNTARDRGYEASSTMSGTRLNSNLADLAASISVVTKQQLIDTASVDINDVFKYEVNTEGTSDWSSFSNDRGTISDDIQMNPYGATRVRGLSAANTALDGFNSNLPFDSYDVDAVEISRGPNSSVFGLGQTGGGINVIRSLANTNRNISTVAVRTDSSGGFRSNFDFNQVLKKNVLAVRALGVIDYKGYERKPSYDRIRRLQAQVTYRPFKNTTIHGSFESYRESYDRPNSTTPRDGVTDWILEGKPTWDPLTHMVHYADGRSYGPIASTSAAESVALSADYYKNGYAGWLAAVANHVTPAGLPATIQPFDTGFATYPSAYITNGGIQLYNINELPAATGTGPTSAPTSGTLPAHLLYNTTFYNRFSTQYPLYVSPGFTNKALYDWTSVNLAAPNYGQQKGETSTFSLEQTILETPRQLLAFQGSWQSEHITTNDRSFLGTYGNAGGKFQVAIDTNEKLLDGSANPYFLQPYLGYPRPGASLGRTYTDFYRAVLAYRLDLSKEKNWMHWLGAHNFSLYGEFLSIHTAKLGFTPTISSDEAWMSATGVSSSRNSAGYRYFAHYVVGDANQYNVDFGPRGLLAPPFSTTLRYYNGVTRQWVDEPVNIADYYYANRPNRRLLSTYGGTWQGSFLSGRVIPTFGVRKDYNRTRDANSAINPTTATDGFYILPDAHTYGAYDWVQRRGKTTTEGGVVKPWHWLNLLYNQASSFNPSSTAYTVNGEPLPDPRGKTRDYGVQLSFFNDRLSIRAVQYETIDFGRADSTINTYVQRTLRMDGGPDTPVSYPITTSDPNLAAWYGNELQLAHPSWGADQVTAEVIRATGVDPTFIAGHYSKTHGDSGTSTSRGKEIEIAFNPNEYWTLRATGSQTRAFNALMSPDLLDYIAARLPLWTTIRSPYDNRVWWTSTVGSTTPQTFYTNNVYAPVALAVALQGKQKTQERQYHFRMVTNYRLAGLTNMRVLKNMAIGGAVRWESQASIGYLAGPADSDGIVRTLDPNKPAWDKSRYYFDLNARYDFRCFNDKVHCRLQLNVNNAFESGRLQTIAVNPDGSPYAYRIIDPRQFILSATFDL